jgi:hypothetical protein
LNCRWLPVVATRRQPSASRRRITSRTFTRARYQTADTIAHSLPSRTPSERALWSFESEIRSCEPRLDQRGYEGNRPAGTLAPSTAKRLARREGLGRHRAAPAPLATPPPGAERRTQPVTVRLPRRLLRVLAKDRDARTSRCSRPSWRRRPRSCDGSARAEGMNGGVQPLATTPGRPPEAT